jgi:NADH-quinone oxidoreductase subunit D
MKYRESVLDIFEMITGNRNNYAMFKIGGVRRDIPNAMIPEIRSMLEGLKPKIALLTGAVMDDPVIHARTKGVGILSAEAIKNMEPLALLPGLPASPSM